VTSALTVSFLIGSIAGLRSLTAPAIVCWAVNFGWLRPPDAALAFLKHPITLTTITVLALIELIVDKLPRTPARTAPIGLIARLVLGGGCGVAIAIAKQTAPTLEAITASVGAVVAAFAGYNLRHVLVSSLDLPDFAVALFEDAIAIGGGFLILSHV
jgi:uncharacterized membrane protein